MSDTPQELERLGADVKASWQRFLDAFEPLRPELYRYCRHLTQSPWDAEDLAQDAMARAFVTLGTLFSNLPAPRAWLFRVASNIWIDRVRRARFELLQGEHAQSEAPSLEPQAAREAAATLLALLSPQQRVAVVLKDVFDFSLEEIAAVLETTPNTVKAALHRGRGRLSEPLPRVERAPAPGVLESFARAFNARDLEGLTALLLDTASVEIVGLVTEYGPEAAKDPETGSFAGTMSPLTIDERGGIAPELLEGDRGAIPRCEVLPYHDRWLLVFWFEDVRGPVVRCLMLAEHEGDRIRHLRNYFFSPQVLDEVCSELGLPHRLNGYRYWPSG
ncbi:MAG TPA: RNA polymerase sigma factor [Polyangiaceae bacterium]|nr:RNA polymerase sigma factor [Polyangiaceae bacterium]